MALAKFGFIVSGAQLDPTRHRLSMTSPAFEMIAVGVGELGQAPAVALQMVDDSVQLIELCGGFGPCWTARVSMPSSIVSRLAPSATGQNPSTACTPSSSIDQPPNSLKPRRVHMTIHIAGGWSGCPAACFTLASTAFLSRSRPQPSSCPYH